MAQAPTPTSRPAQASHAAHAGSQAHAKASDKPAMPFGAPAVQRAGKHLVAVGTVIHQDEHGKRTQIEHGQPIPDGFDAKALKHLQRNGAAAPFVGVVPAPGVEQKQAEWTYDAARGVWLDEQGGVHQAIPQPADDNGNGKKSDDDED